MFSYKYLDDVAIADTAFEAWADSWEGLFAASTEALMRVMVDPESVRDQRTHILELSAATIEELLYDWLSEIVYLKDTEGLLVKSADIHIAESTIWDVHGVLHGETIDPARHRLGQDVKAITYHMFDVAREGHDHRAKIVLDI